MHYKHYCSENIFEDGSKLRIIPIIHICMDNIMFKWSWDSVAGIAAGCELDDCRVGVQVLAGLRIFSSPCPSDWLLDPPSFLSMGTVGGLFPQG
jgi:hypothetical protein